MALLRFIGAPFAFLLALTGIANADAGSAEQDFRRGLSELEEGRYADARESFSTSLADVPSAAAAFNLAIAMRGTGQPVQGLAILEALLRGDFGTLQVEEQNEIENIRAELRQALGFLVLRVTGPRESRVSLAIDGRLSPLLPRIPLDPGLHLLELSAPGYVVVSRWLPIHRGETAETQLDLSPLPSRPLRRSAWLWSLVAIGVAGISAALAVSLTREDSRVTNNLVPGGGEVTL